MYIICLVSTIYQKQQQTNQAFGCHSTTLATLRLGCFGAIAVQHDPHPNIGKRSDAVAVEHSPESFGCGDFARYEGSWGVVYVAGQASYVGRIAVINYLVLSKNGECSIMAVRGENFNPDVEDDLRQSQHLDHWNLRQDSWQKLDSDWGLRMTWLLELCYSTTIGFSIVFLIVHDSNDTLDTTVVVSVQNWQVVRCMILQGRCWPRSLCLRPDNFYDIWKACSLGMMVISWGRIVPKMAKTNLVWTFLGFMWFLFRCSSSNILF